MNVKMDITMTNGKANKTKYVKPIRIFYVNQKMNYRKLLQEEIKMLPTIQLINRAIWQFLSSTKFQFVLRVMLMTSLMLLWRQAFAGDDPLEGTDASLAATLGSSGTGRKFIYLVEGVVAVAAYIKTKNVLMFSGVVAIAIFLNILFKVAGVAA